MRAALGGRRSWIESDLKRATLLCRCFSGEDPYRLICACGGVAGGRAVVSGLVFGHHPGDESRSAPEEVPTTQSNGLSSPEPERC